MQKPRNEEFFLLFFTEYILLARVMETIKTELKREREREERFLVIKISNNKNMIIGRIIIIRRV